MDQPLSKKYLKKKTKKEKLDHQEKHVDGEHLLKVEKSENQQLKQYHLQQDNARNRKRKSIENANEKQRQKGNKKQIDVKVKKNNSKFLEADDDEQQLNFNNIVAEQKVEVSFLISQINQQQYHSMKTILQKFARITGIISSQWADAIINNSKAGNSVLVDEDEQEVVDEQEKQQSQNNQKNEIQQQDDEQNVCNGVINLLSYQNKLTKKVLQKVMKSINKKKQIFNGNQNPLQILSKNKCSLLICERAINLPAFIVKSMHEILINDLKQLRKTNNLAYIKICGDYLFGLSQVEIPNNSKNNIADIQQMIFNKFEDYLFLKESMCWWIGESSPNSVRKIPLHKLNYIVTMEKYFSAVGQIQELLQQQ